MKTINNEVREIISFLKMSGSYYKLYCEPSFKRYYRNNFSSLIGLRKQYYDVVARRIFNCSEIKDKIPGQCTVHKTNDGLYCITSKLGIITFSSGNKATNYAISLYLLSEFNLL